MSRKSEVGVLFVCMGNICRSPTAEGVFRHLLREEGMDRHIHTDSAGTHAYHVGDPPDRRAQATAVARGIDISDLRARRVAEGDFQRFDYVLAMDQDNHAILADLCPPGREERLALFLEFAPEVGLREVPDPYYGGPEGFERVFDMVEAASAGLLAHIREHHLRD
ncbi:MAG TPA: low molecular weight phosphotyrosine protein phosphatase [Gammaproteobacteria bacterium]|nr:low molecular weight phosphotyrosine protein phosphatase [Gammaproteobacteria bacterium]